MMRIVSIVGARPQFIKAGAVSREIAKHSDIFETVVHTGQHFNENMSDIFFKELQIPTCKYNLGINSKTHSNMTGRMLQSIEEVLIDEEPDLALVYGDTNSTLAGALAAAKIPIPVAHIEAGLRSYDMQMPEEINRVVTDHISTLLFCPTQEAVENLKNENIFSGNILNQKVYNVGDVMYDAFQTIREISDGAILDKLDIRPNCYIFATIHRASNTDQPFALKEVFDLLDFASQKCKTVVLQIHPRTKQRIKEFNITIPPSIKIIEPVSYSEAISLLQNSYIIITDSGGLQKEALWAQKPCITVRDKTEWVETVKCGFNFLVGRDISKFIDAMSKVKNIDFHSEDYVSTISKYGNGLASKRIVEIIKNEQNV